MYCRALAVQRNALTPHHPSVLATLSALCKLYLSHSDQLGAQSSQPATLASLGQLFHDSGMFEEAELHMQKAAELLQESLPPTHPQVASILLALKKLYEDMGNQEQVDLLGKRLMVMRRYMDHRALGEMVDGIDSEDESPRSSAASSPRSTSDPPSKQSLSSLPTDSAKQTVS